MNCKKVYESPNIMIQNVSYANAILASGEPARFSSWNSDAYDSVLGIGVGGSD